MDIGLYDHGFFDDDDEFIEVFNIRRRPRIFRPRINFNLDGIDTRTRFRLTLDHVDMLEDRIGHLLEHPSAANHALTPRQQIMASLRYLATGSYYRPCGDAQGISTATLSRTLHRFVSAINRELYAGLVDWPADPEQRRGIANKFLELRGMPSVFGCVDGSHVDIIAPSIDEPDYVNRHGLHSINAMFVCGPSLRFYNVSSRWPGSVHDARVFRNSALKARLDTGWRPIDQGVLLGDSAYGDCAYLVTPIAAPRTPAERHYNAAHRRTRNLVECAIGLLKQRFRCLLDKMYFPDPSFAAEVVRCCAALHNMMVPDDEAEDFIREFDREDGGDDGQENRDRNAEHVGDMTRRRQLVALFE